MAIRAVPHSTTGFSSNFLTFGREVRLPGDPLPLEKCITDLPMYAAQINSSFTESN